MLDTDITELEWDSAFFKRKIYNLDINYLSQLKSIDKKYTDTLIQIKLPAARLDLIDKVQHLNFKFVESELIFDKKIVESTPMVQEIKYADITDEASILKIAKQSFLYSRYREPWFNKNDASNFYMQWAKNAINKNFDDVCIKVENEKTNALAGFITAKIHQDNQTAKIGLIGIDKLLQNKNYGQFLIGRLTDWVNINKLLRIEVATQGSNIKAVNFYLKNEFKVHSLNYWFYKI